MDLLHVPAWGWAAAVAGLVAMLGIDLVASARRRGPVRLPEAAAWTAAAVGLGVAFGVLLATTVGGTAAGQFYAGWLTEYSLSLDNLLVFLLLISRSGVPRELHGRVLLLGIILALCLRGVLIAAGGTALAQFGWVQYLFGAFLIFSAARMVGLRGTAPGTTGSGAAGTASPGAARAARVARQLLPVAATGDGARLVTREGGRRYVTPLLILVIAIGVTDLMFALDSIPAIFGLTRDPFLVFTANVFALVGLRHLYFLVGGLLSRLVHLTVGLAAVLAFVGLKLVAQALRSSGVGEIGPVPVPEISAGMSLAIIAAVIMVITVTSLAASRRRALPAVVERAAVGHQPTPPPDGPGTGPVDGLRQRRVRRERA